MHRAYLLLPLLCACGSENLADSLPDAKVSCQSSGVVVQIDTTGGAYSPGPDDPRSNTSSILQSSVTLSAFAYTEHMEAIMSCVRTDFAAFNLEITETAPSSPDFFKVALIGDDSTALGLSAGIPSIAPFSCDELTKAVGFVSGGLFPNGAGLPQPICNNISWVIAKFFNLDNTVDCDDINGYGCNGTDPSVADVDATCGEFEPRACNCDTGATTQNSYQILLDRFGPACP